MKVYLKKKFFDKTEQEYLSDNEMIVYVALRTIYRLEKIEYYITINSILYELYGNTTYQRSIRDKIIDGLLLLDKRGLIQACQVTNSDFIINLEELYIESIATEGKEQDFYTMIRDDEVHAIFNLKTNHNKVAMLRYFVNIIGSINYQIYSPLSSGSGMITNFVGYMPILYLAKISGITKSKAIDYNVLFEEMRMLYIQRSNMYTIENENIRNIRNHYGRYKDMEHIEAFAEKYYESVGILYNVAKKTKAQSDNKRSLKQKYNQMLKGKEYDAETVKEIYRYIHACNETYKQNYLEKKGVYVFEPECLMDETIFEEYVFLSDEEDMILYLPDDTPVYASEDSDEPIMTKAEFVKMFYTL